ncbi:hypothetical protein BEL04_03510 [Mucilaginibacter sp. PPCGB 2223]|uniref:hypothetical protein n=1 Tax=Mucilaginibacter sp. PPCGB 2223 TaxID=1886027 RepID=UPI00082403EF|nr:hypothetical protein [Mucilaginibacter sp. PPCGB 2223]OCX53381.1 hypothetical protein BEL04_03510 [Mucilaginibacter sp. PPCGB 2223]
MKKLWFLVLFPLTVSAQKADTLRYLPYLQTLVKNGKRPLEFVKEKLSSHPLLIFDDGLHSAADPFVFYQQIASDTSISRKLNIFLEVVPSNSQKYINAYLNSPVCDSTLLFRAFQDDYSTGFPYQTYFDLFKTIYHVNQILPPNEKIKVYAVGFPVYWGGINDRQDLAAFRDALADYDFHMYQTILNIMLHFQGAERGIFLTNTRHAYKAISAKNGQLQWNCNTYFNEWNPGKTYSIRINNATLFIESVKKLAPGTSVSAAGTERFNYHFDRMANGLWDYAADKYNNYPVAIDINHTPFGTDAYVGNLMLNVKPGTKMDDAYDAVIFLKPIEQMQQTAIINYIYTPEFISELSRRYQLLYSQQEIDQQLKEANVKTLRELLIKMHPYSAEIVLPQVTHLSDINQWKNSKITP